MIDFYPLHPKNNWNASNQDNLIGDLPIQSSLDYKTLSHYYAAKKRCMELDIPFYVVPVSAGRWIVRSPNSNWDYYMMPTGNMQKCLQLLPLCYGVDGVINWKIYDSNLSNPISEYNHEPYETASMRLEYDKYKNSNTQTQWYALVERNGDNIESDTPQFEAICQANDKLSKYGKIMKERNLHWKNALCVTTSTESFTPHQSYDYVCYEPSTDIGQLLNNIKKTVEQFMLYRVAVQFDGRRRDF